MVKLGKSKSINSTTRPVNRSKPRVVNVSPYATVKPRQTRINGMDTTMSVIKNPLSSMNSRTSAKGHPFPIRAYGPAAEKLNTEAHTSVKEIIGQKETKTLQDITNQSIPPAQRLFSETLVSIGKTRKAHTNSSTFRQFYNNAQKTIKQLQPDTIEKLKKVIEELQTLNIGKPSPNNIKKISVPNVSRIEQKVFQNILQKSGRTATMQAIMNQTKKANSVNLTTRQKINNALKAKKNVLGNNKSIALQAAIKIIANKKSNKFTYSPLSVNGRTSNPRLVSTAYSSLTPRIKIKRVNSAPLKNMVFYPPE